MTSVFGDYGISRAQAATLTGAGIRSGAVYSINTQGTTPNAAQAMAADLIYAHPVWISEAAPFAGIQISVGTAVVATNGKLALYGPGANGVAGPLVEECAAAVDMSATANTINQANFAANRTLFGRYWLAVKFNGAAIPHSLPQGGVYGNGAAALYGAPTLALYVRAVGSGAAFTRATMADAYANAFPAALTLSFGTGAPGVPIMGLVAA